MVVAKQKNAGSKYHNIDASGFRHGEYVGYGGGTWRIKKEGVWWTARNQDASAPHTDFSRKSLHAISEYLEKLSKEQNERNGARRNSTSTEVRSPTSTETSTEAYTADNVTVTGGAGAGATTKVTIIKKNPSVYKGYILKRNKQGHVLVYRKGSDIVIMGAINMASAKKMIDAASKKNPVKRNTTAADFRSHQKIRLQELAAMFQGEASGEKRRVAESDYTPSKKYRLGYLKLLKIKDSGKVIPITVNGDEKGVEAYLAADLKNNLLIVGKDSRIEGIKLPPKGQLKYLGELSQIDYVTSKKHIGGGKLIHFYHKLGEVTGERPNLFVDDDGFPIIQGGSYDIWNIGIVN